FPARRWEAFARSSGNPLEPTVGEAIDAALGPSEARKLVEHVRPLVERGEGAWRIAVAYLWAS
ncbi:MAG TPA: chemotaxis protein CheR, partial [Candidatus Limnocylindria bacterium]|nr:chemotaxis protein CheR [Candidatus Limnocylindria bacterium]